MKKFLNISALIFLMVFTFTTLLQAELHRLGLLRENPRTHSWIKEADIQVSPTLPSTFYNPAFMPPVGNQGSQGSCTAWAVGYYFKTYQEAHEKGWDPAQTEHQCSPAFLYNLINGGQDGGSFISDAFLALSEMGCGTMADMPYNAGNFTSWPGEAAFENGIPFRTQDTYFIYTGSPTGINQIKQVINSGELLVIGISVYPNFDNISSFNYTYCVNDVYGSIRGGHAVAIIGYDDNKVTNDGVGAFRMINSWGAGWGQAGYWWMSYEAVMSTLLCHGSAYYATDRTNYSPSLLARYQVDHPKRGTVGIKVGVGTTLNSLWETSYFNFYMNQWNTDPNPYPSNPVVLDASDGAPFFTPGTQNNFYLLASDEVADGMSGQVSFFRGESNAQMMNTTAGNLPQAIPDGGSLPLAVAIGGGMSVYPLSLNFGSVMMGQPVQQDIQLNNLSSVTQDLSLQLTNPGGGHFTLSQNLVNLTPGQSETVQVTFLSPVQGTDQETVQISGTGYGAIVRLKGRTTGTLSLTPDQHNFGQVNVGGSQSTQFVVRNLGPNVEQVGLVIEGPDAGHFQVSLSQLQISPADSQFVTVNFAPTSAEYKSAFLKIESTGQVHKAFLEGFGLGICHFSCPVSSLNKSVLLGDSLTALLEIFNTGSAALNFTAALDFGGSGGGWAQIQNPTGTIVPGGSKKLQILLRGQTAGIQQASCLITTNEPGLPVHSVPINLKTIPVNQPPHFTTCYNGAAFNPMLVRMVHAEQNGEELEAGDEIALYDGSLCVGTARLRFTVGMGSCILPIQASQDNPGTPIVDGFTDGNAIEFRVWDASAATEYTAGDIQFLSPGGQTLPPQPFASNGSAIVQMGQITGLQHTNQHNIPTDFALKQNYPNPFNPGTTIRFSLPAGGNARLEVFNSLGQRVVTLLNRRLEAGEFEADWNATSQHGDLVPSGIYFYRLVVKGPTREWVGTKKMILMR